MQILPDRGYLRVYSKFKIEKASRMLIIQKNVWNIQNVTSYYISLTKQYIDTNIWIKSFILL